MMSKIANYGDDLDVKLCLRLTTRQYRYLCQMCKYKNMTPSGYIRKLIDLSISTGGKYEYDLSNSDDLVQLGEVPEGTSGRIDEES